MQASDTVNSSVPSGTQAASPVVFQCRCCREEIHDILRTFRKATLCKPCYATISYVIKDPPRIRQALELLKTREMRNV
jgi:hypothetical protein